MTNWPRCTGQDRVSKPGRTTNKHRQTDRKETDKRYPKIFSCLMSKSYRRNFAFGRKGKDFSIDFLLLLCSKRSNSVVIFLLHFQKLEEFREQNELFKPLNFPWRRKEMRLIRNQRSVHLTNYWEKAARTKKFFLSSPVKKLFHFSSIKTRFALSKKREI